MRVICFLKRNGGCGTPISRPLARALPSGDTGQNRRVYGVCAYAGGRARRAMNARRIRGAVSVPPLPYCDCYTTGYNRGYLLRH